MLIPNNIYKILFFSLLMKKRNKIENKNKRAQLKLSFGMIFSIILIVFFLVFAFFGIKKFLDTRDTIVTESFKKSLQDDIDQMWRSSRGSDDKIYSLPNKVEAVCFEDDDYWNLVIIPEDYDGAKIKHIDIDKTLKPQVNPGVRNGRLCFPSEKGKVTIWLEKDYQDELITIIRK